METAGEGQRVTQTCGEGPDIDRDSRRQTKAQGRTNKERDTWREKQKRTVIESSEKTRTDHGRTTNCQKMKDRQMQMPPWSAELWHGSNDWWFGCVACATEKENYNCLKYSENTREKSTICPMCIYYDELWIIGATSTFLVLSGGNVSTTPPPRLHQLARGPAPLFRPNRLASAEDGRRRPSLPRRLEFA